MLILAFDKTVSPWRE